MTLSKDKFKGYMVYLAPADIKRLQKFAKQTKIRLYIVEIRMRANLKVVRIVNFVPQHPFQGVFCRIKIKTAPP